MIRGIEDADDGISGVRTGEAMSDVLAALAYRVEIASNAVASKPWCDCGHSEAEHVNDECPAPGPPGEVRDKPEKDDGADKLPTEHKPVAGDDEMVVKIREVARECGYALAVHGSRKRDLDIIAAPWKVEAVSAWELVDTICEKVGLLPLTPDQDKDLEGNPEAKPWGRLAWALHGVPGYAAYNYVDLSVVPRAGEAVPLQLVDDRSMLMSLELRRGTEDVSPKSSQPESVALVSDTQTPDPLTVKCPYCRRRKGLPCRDAYTSIPIREEQHPERVEAARVDAVADKPKDGDEK